MNTRRAIFGAALAVTAFAATGCVQPPPVKDTVRMATTPEQLRSAPTQPALRPAEPVVEKPRKKTTTVAKQPELSSLAEPQDAPVYSAAELVGKSQSEVAAMIGTPARVQQRAASTVWTYQNDECGLDVFFFLDVATSDERVLTIEPTPDLNPANTAPAEATASAPAAPSAPAATVATTADPATGAAPGDAAGGSVVDTCYGKLRRS